MKKINLDEKTKNIITLIALGFSLLVTVITLWFTKIEDVNTLGWLSRGGNAYAYIFLFLSFFAILASGYSFFNYFILKKNKIDRLRLGAIANFISMMVVVLLSVLLPIGNRGFIIFLMFVVFFLFLVIQSFSTRIQKIREGKEQPPVTIDEIKENIQKSGQTFRSILFVSVTLLLLFANSVAAMLIVPHNIQNTSSGSLYTVFHNLLSFGTADQIMSILYSVLMFVNVALIANLVLKFLKNTITFLQSAKRFAKYNIFLSVFVFVYAYIRVFIAKFSVSASVGAVYLNVIIAVLLYIVFTFFAGRAERETLRKHYPEKLKKKRELDAKPLVFQIIMTAATLLTLPITLYKLEINSPMSVPVTESATGASLIFGSTVGFQNIFSLVLMMGLLLSLLFMVFTVINYIVKADNYKQATLSYAYGNLFIQFFYFVIGLFFVLMVPSFESLLGAILDEQVLSHIGDISKASEYITTETKAYLPLLLGFISFVCMQLLCFKKKSLVAEESGAKTEEKQGKTEKEDRAEKEAPEASPISAAQKTEETSDNPCPAFSELDGNRAKYEAELALRKGMSFNGVTLPMLTEFIQEFAKNMPERLSYTKETIATFIAGLGASRLSILQGMSGTGKTSLPLAFMQAINGNCEIVEVESSWRDKNELLGYYNEFSKKYTPKKFTQFLYKANLNSAVPTFIVLDEMNLSRIEYYFSDFLSLMEMREDKRAIKLLDIQLFPPKEEDEKQSGYVGLSEGHTIKIPPNVWFIGTANRDESTFEISDKVYDRAQTMIFEKRAPKILTPKEEVAPRFVEYSQLARLFSEAKQKEFNAEKNPLIQAVEKLLAPYKISFGNRILKQIEDFVKVYVACFEIKTQEEMTKVVSNAIEQILFSKVVRKLELKIIEDKTKLVQGFEKLNFFVCASFVNDLAN